MNISSKLPLLGALALVSLTPAQAAWFTFTNTNSFQLLYQGAPPPTDATVTAGTYDGAPCNWAGTQQIDNIKDTKWTQGDGMYVWVWGNRMNYLADAAGVRESNDRPNGIPPTFSSNNGALLQRSEPLPWDSTVLNYQASELVTSGGDWWQSGATYSGTPTGTPGSDPNWTKVTPNFWVSGSSYALNAVVFDKNSHNWYKSLVASNTSTPPSKWTDVTSTEKINPPECRFEYGSTTTAATYDLHNYAIAIASDIVQTAWLVGNPPHAEDHTGYLDIAAQYGLKVYADTGTTGAVPPVYDPATHDLNNQTIIDGDFNKRPIDPTGLGGSNYAVKTNGVSLPIYRLSDCWRDYTMGAPYSTGQLIRDDKNLVPNNFWADPVTGNSGTAGYGHDAYTVSTTNPSGGGLPGPLSGTFTMSGGSVFIVGSNRAVRERYVISTSPGAAYQVQVSGSVVIPANVTGTAGKVMIQAIGLDSTGTNQVGSTVDASFIPVNYGTAAFPQFTYTTTFNATGTGVLWPAGSAYLRFSVNTNFGVTGTSNMTIAINSLSVKNAADTTPTYWRSTGTASGTFTTPAFTGTTPFPTFANYRTTNPAWKHQQLGMELDYEVADHRPCSGSLDYTGTITVSNTDQNVLYLFDSLHKTLNAKGYLFSVYTDDLDANKGNSLVEANIANVFPTLDTLVPIVGGGNIRANDVRAAAAANYNFLKYLNSNPTSGTRANFSPSKVGLALELMDKNAGESNPISNITTSGSSTNPTNLLQVTAPGESAAAGRYVYLSGINGGTSNPLNNTVFRVKGGVAGQTGTFRIDKVVTPLNPTESSTDTAIEGVYYSQSDYLPGNNAPMPGYVVGDGGMEASGGSSVAEFAYIKKFLADRSVWHVEIWRDYSIESHNPPPAPAALTMVQLIGGQTVVTSGSSVAGFNSKRVDIDGITNPQVSLLNGSTYTAVTSGSISGTVLSGTVFALDGYNGANLISASPTILTGTATATNAYTRNVFEKLQAFVLP